ncbi:hypothetical protein [Pedobacter antarcticus]|uniref:hypothetical protein n=1 Tax=Pedobacter antarcticus TaxID=34086 RepID=UPI00292E4B87|nr:hypothetical protein [Pedobacter antarcticus]
MKKSNKTFVLSDDRFNSEDFRVLTSGIDISIFLRNPIMLYNGIRPGATSIHDLLPIGFWEDIRMEGNTLYGVPVFDESDWFAMLVYDKVESGLYTNAGCRLEALKWSDDQNDKLPGQEVKILTQSLLLDASIMGNPFSTPVIMLEDSNGDDKGTYTSRPIELGVISNQQIKIMEKESKQLTGQLLTDAYSAHKITMAELQTFKGMVNEGNAQSTLKGILDNRPDGYAVRDLADKSWDELDRSNELVLLKKYQPNVYNEKFFKKWGKQPKN